MKKYAIPVLAFATTVSCQNTKQNEVQNQEQQSEKPNIIVVLVDDMGYSDLGCYGSEIQTPNLDFMAKNGVIFSQFYNCARSCPSRAAILTGLYPHQTGVGAMSHNYEHPNYQGYLNKNCATIAELLKTQGYATYASGKWHVGSHDESQYPTNRGFDRYMGLLNGAGSFYSNVQWTKKKKNKMRKDGKFFTPPENWYATDAYTDYAIECIEETEADKPFFIYLAHTAPHWPLHALPEDIAKYRGKYKKRDWDTLRKKRYERMIEAGIIKKEWQLSERFNPNVKPWADLTEEEKDLWDNRMAVYAAMVDRVDQGLGKILDKLKQEDRLNNTLIMFLSDNGGCAEEVSRWSHIIHDRSGAIGSAQSFDSYGYRGANFSNTPFRLHKSYTMEGGIATSFIAYMPGQIKGNQISHEMAHITDIMATCLDYAGCSYPEEYNGNKLIPMDGKSLKPVFEGQEREGHEFLCWEHLGNIAIRQGKWKLCASYKDPYNGWERKYNYMLFDMENDRTETNNLYEKNEKLAQELLEKYNRWAENTGVLPRDSVLVLRKAAFSK